MSVAKNYRIATSNNSQCLWAFCPLPTTRSTVKAHTYPQWLRHQPAGVKSKVPTESRRILRNERHHNEIICTLSRFPRRDEYAQRKRLTKTIFLLPRVCGGCFLRHRAFVTPSQERVSWHLKTHRRRSTSRRSSRERRGIHVPRASRTYLTHCACHFALWIKRFPKQSGHKRLQ